MILMINHACEIYVKKSFIVFDDDHFFFMYDG